MISLWDSLSPEERARRVREHLAVNHVGCAACGYDLVGLDGTKSCPECGEPIEERRFAFLAAEPDEQYRARRLAEYLEANHAACPGCGKQLDHVDARACPHCRKELEVWELIPCGLRGGRRARLKWAAIFMMLYVVLAAVTGALVLYAKLH